MDGAGSQVAMEPGESLGERCRDEIGKDANQRRRPDALARHALAVEGEHVVGVAIAKASRIEPKQQPVQPLAANAAFGGVAMVGHAGCRRDDPALVAESHQRAQSLELRGEHAPAERGQPVVATPLVVLVGGRPLVLTRRSAVCLEPADRAVEISRLERDRAVGVLEDVLTDSVSVAVAGGEHGEHEQLDRLEREQRLDWRIGAGRPSVLSGI